MHDLLLAQGNKYFKNRSLKDGIDMLKSLK